MEERCVNIQTSYLFIFSLFSLFHDKCVSTTRCMKMHVCVCVMSLHGAMAEKEMKKKRRVEKKEREEKYCTGPPGTTDDTLCTLMPPGIS